MGLGRFRGIMSAMLLACLGPDETPRPRTEPAPPPPPDPPEPPLDFGPQPSPRLPPDEAEALCRKRFAAEIDDRIVAKRVIEARLMGGVLITHHEHICLNPPRCCEAMEALERTAGPPTREVHERGVGRTERQADAVSALSDWLAGHYKAATARGPGPVIMAQPVLPNTIEVEIE